MPYGITGLERVNRGVYRVKCTECHQREGKSARYMSWNYMGSGSITQLILILSTRWRHMVNLMPQLESAHITYWIGGFVVPGVGLDALQKKRTSCSSKELNFNSLVLQPTVTSLYWRGHGVWTQMYWFWIMFPISHILLVSIFSSLLSCLLYKVKCNKNSEQDVLAALFETHLYWEPSLPIARHT